MRSRSRERPSRRRPWASWLLVAGCALSVVTVFVPVMRWSQNAAHDTAGSARIWYGDEWTLADGGFAGAALLPFASGAAVVLAGVALVARERAWTLQVVIALAAAYLPLWTAVAFARKWEDDVDPDVGALMLVGASVAVATGLWSLRRPRGAATDRLARPAHPRESPAS